MSNPAVKPALAASDASKGGPQQDHRHHLSVAVRLLTPTDLPDLLARYPDLFEGLTFPGV